ncbi:hypothetical protein H257_13152 [Aphanomyces astaci]|uniref:Nuclear control of ATPase protein 2 n=1 Tax=Aphanomyces astaci TaxID=112090 RepID=W4FW22_APHAT|nr:hypothetical protein H257_13152 [Aphanomyces astaci]ETV71725.1 hypothetical protein H257_13152 [Aphanomyces astaci]|eukprot:XP_009838913.1 hypothetical protein H257_13152 [Aphanomyces astaci]
MAPSKAAIVQAKIRHELRLLHENGDVSESIQHMAAYFLELMHQLAHNTIAVADVVDAHHRMESFLVANATSQHIVVFESAMLELTRAAIFTALHESLRALLSFGAFVPSALRYWKRQLKQPLDLFLLTLPDKVWEPSGGVISTDDKIRILDETYETMLVHIGELKQQMLKWPHAEPNRYQDMMHTSRTLLLKVFSTKHLTIRPNAVTIDAAETVGASALASSGRPRYELKSVLDFLSHLPVLRATYKGELDSALEGCTIPPFLRRRWWQVSVGAVGVSLGVMYVVRNSHELHDLALTMHKGIRDFVVDHMVVPLNNIVGEILLSKKSLIQDPLALNDSKESLQRMLADFIHDTNPSLPLSVQHDMVANMDMSVVSLQYEKELPKAVRNLVTGDIVRMMLIQIQFIKKELMVAMKAIDDLMDANQLNMQMMATLPMFVVAGGAYFAISKTSRLLYQFTSSAMYEDPKSVASQIRYTLRDIERLLNMQNTSHASIDSLPGLSSQMSTSTMSPLLRAASAAGDGPGTTLGVRDMGYLVVLLDQLQQLFERNRGYFDDAEQKRFDEDVNDLVGDHMLVSQQLAVIARMYHSHAFLAQGVSSKWFH